MKKLIVLLVSLCVSVTHAQSSGQTAVGQKIVNTIEMLKIVKCPKMSGDPFGLAASVCLSAGAISIRSLAAQFNRSLGSKMNFPKWEILSDGVHINYWENGDNYFPLALFSYKGTTYIRIHRGFLGSKFPSIVKPQSNRSAVTPMSIEGKAAINQIVIDLQGEITDCESSGTEKVCAVSPLSKTLVKALIASQRQVKQIEAWTQAGELLVANFTVNNKAHMMILSPSADDGTFVQWFRNY